MNIKRTAIFIFIFSYQAWSQTPVAPVPTAAPVTLASPATTSTPGAITSTSQTASTELGDARPNGRRIRRQLNLILGVDHDEEFLIPMRDITFKGAGATENFDITRLKGTDFFRFTPKKVASGIATINDIKTGQVLVEIRYDIRDATIEKQMREIQSLLGDIEGVEFKIINNQILLDGYVLLSRDLIRIANVIRQFPGAKSLVTLSPIARKKVAEYMARDVNNPEVSITAVGDYIKLEGVVNSPDEHKRITRIVGLYMPDLVTDQAPDTDSVKITGRREGKDISNYIIDLITERKDEEKVEPPPKMVQIVVHFVQFAENYGKNFLFLFAPSFAAGTTSAGTVNDTYNLIDRLAPKLQWAKGHGYARVLDTASILTQDKKRGQYKNVVTFTTTTSTTTVTAAGPTTSQQPSNINANVSLDVTPTIKSERSGLIEMNIGANVDDHGDTQTTTNSVSTTISVRDRQSAAFAGIIKKKSENNYGGDPGVAGAIVSFQAKKKFDKTSSNFVVFVTPIIKSSASAGVDQVKKKFRLRE